MTGDCVEPLGRHGVGGRPPGAPRDYNPGSIFVTCPDGWTQSNGTWTCLKLFHDSKVTWDEARKACKTLGSDLVRITDTEKNAFITKTFKSSSDSTHIGLSGTINSGLQWLDEQSQATMFIWKTPIINLAEEKLCGVLDLGPVDSGKWEFKNCQDKRNYICEKGPESCPAEWIPHAHSTTCIRWSESKESYHIARRKCQRNWSDLVTIRDEKKNRFIEDLLKTLSENGWWIGLNNHNSYQTLRWLDDPKDPPYKDFDEGSTSVTYGCVYFFISKHATHRWSEDHECNFKKRYICEYAPVCSGQMHGTRCSKRCSPNCAGTVKNCFRLTGHCMNGCLPGYKGYACDTACEKSTYGDNCAKKCSIGCLNNECDNIQGTCSNGCKAGYIREKCNKRCENATYGENCSKNCSIGCSGPKHECDIFNGTCLFGCTAGYQSDRCDKSKNIT
ncbi:hypothetical protein RRG08_061517 [Elysia crispata]|uniref:C-type lectin domain-containing protein n=1 Tax=Elysia crispata TaxID=231223 RepID=A0AAE0Y2Q3_9GAST|nr:hypothetical protein RRG08_061517 [Elysia crispata]